jgi:hypothetical protein
VCSQQQAEDEQFHHDGSHFQVLMPLYFESNDFH